MLGIKKRDTKQVFKAIAHQQGVSVSEVKERIQSTIDEMYYSDDPDVQAEFSSYFGKKRPTPEEYVYMIIPGLSEPPVRTLRATIPENESHIFR